MVEYYNEHDCDNHVTHKDPMEDVQRFVANYYTSLLTKLRNHIADAYAGHVSAEEKEYWNNKADKVSVRDLEEMFVNLKNKINNIEETVIADLKQWFKREKYITENDLITYVTNQINKIISGEIDLTGYAKESWVIEQIRKMTGTGGELDLSKYALKTDLDALAARVASLEVNVTNITNRITNIENGGGGKNYEITGMSVSGSTLTITQNNMGSKSVTLPSSGSTTSGITQDEADDRYIKKNTLKNLKFNINGSTSTYNPEQGALEVTINTGSGGGDGADGGYYKPYFQNNKSSVTAPQLPDNGKTPEQSSTTEGKSWTEEATNRATGEYTWMTQVFVTGAGSYENWSAAICITGDKGSNGEDATDKEFIYIRTKTTIAPDKPTSAQKDGDVPSGGWTDNPQGVDEEWLCEWVCVRTKSNDVWSDWIGPVMWAHYGKNGTDGDGIEYIFAKGYSVPADDPSTWYTNAQSKADTTHSTYNKDEYIPETSKNTWFDDPQELSQGEKAWVSVRKKRNDTESSSSETEDAYWHQYSSPTLWAYYPNDGLAGDAIKLQLDNSTIGINTNSQGYNVAYKGSTGVHFYNNTDEVTDDLVVEIESVVRSDGETVTDTSWLSVNNTQVSIDLAENKLYLTDITYIVTIKGTATTGGKSGVVRKAQLQIVGVHVGEDGASYSLKLGASTVKKSDGAMYPSSVSVSCIKVKGEAATEIKPSSTSSGFTFTYQINGSGDWATLTSDTFNPGNIGDITNSNGKTIGGYATFRLIWGETVVDQQDLAVVMDGIPGTTGISYSIDVIESSLTKTTASDLDVVNGTLKFQVNKRQSSTECLANDKTICTCLISSDDNHPVTATYDASSSAWVLTCENYDLTDLNPYILIKAYEKESTGAQGIFYASTVVPFIVPGKNGESTVQTLAGSPLRYRGSYADITAVEDGETYKFFDGKRAAKDGIMYQDIVLYDNTMYVCINSELGQNDSWATTPDSAAYWSAFSISDNIFTNLLIANKAYIKELSSEEVVIMDDSTIVAGMTSGKAIDTDKSPLPSGTTKGDIRIWAGEFSGGNLATAPFTVSNTGHVKMYDCEIYGFTKRKKLTITEENIDNYLIQVSVEEYDESWYELDITKTGTFVEFYNEKSYGDKSILLPFFDPTYSTDDQVSPIAKLWSFDNACEYLGQTIVIVNKCANDSIYINGINKTASDSSSTTAAISLPAGSTFVATCKAFTYKVDSGPLAGTWFRIGWDYTTGQYRTDV